MTHSTVTAGILALTLAVLLSACALPQQYRKNYEPCGLNDPSDCAGNALQAVDVPEGAQLELGFIEFDDQGQLWDSKQRDAVESEISRLGASNDFLLITYVHGWKHNASSKDTDVLKFRDLMQRIARAEAGYAEQHSERPRVVIGLYLGWRGLSVSLPVAKELTFWTRKNTAEKVGHGTVTAVLSELEAIKRTREVLCENCGRSKLVVIGHSFGAQVVFEAVDQIMVERLVRSDASCSDTPQCGCPPGAVGNVGGFGDLVVLLNPAFEAQQFAVLSDLSTARGTYFASQLPLLVILTSKSDWATRYAFPAGRALSTFFEAERTTTRWNATTRSNEDVSEGDANTLAVGHFEPYRTHTLAPSQREVTAQSAAAQKRADVQLFSQVAREWAEDQPGGTIHFEWSTLERNMRSAGRDPYLVVYVDGKLIRDHGDVFNPRVQEFVTQMALISSQTPAQLKATLSAAACPN